MKSFTASELKSSELYTVVQKLSLLSGVGVIQIPGKKPRLCALINPSTVVCATHYSTGTQAIPAGTPVTFWLSADKAIMTTINQLESQKNDVTTFSLRSPVTDALYYQLATVDEVRNGTRFVATGIKDITTNPQPSSVSDGVSLKSVASGIATFRQSTDVRMEAGDSGAPDFVWSADGNQLLLIGPHAGANLTVWTTSIASYFL